MKKKGRHLQQRRVNSRGELEVEGMVGCMGEIDIFGRKEGEAPVETGREGVGARGQVSVKRGKAYNYKTRGLEFSKGN